MTHVGFILPLDTTWMGGQTYLFNLVSSFLESQQYQKNAPKISVLYATKKAPTAFLELTKRYSFELVACPELRELRKPLGLLQLLILRKIPNVSMKLRALGLDVIFSPTLYLGELPDQKVVSWLPDFQHRALPNFFSLHKRILREISYRLCMCSSDRIILSSQDAKKMFTNYYSRKFIGKVHIVPFTPWIKPLSDVEVHKVLQNYKLEVGFFFLPSQFWRHKNHNLLLLALEVLRTENWQGCIVMTGAFPASKNSREMELQERISGLEASGQLVHLGRVSRYDYLALLQASSCLINPSRFEGRSSIVEEAILFGIPMILSNIDVHYEQAGPRARYFSVDDEIALAKAMWMNHPKILRTELANDAIDRRELFSRALVDALSFE